jgi:ABC-type bacteriocin/lantibiotic exporter with double-glycine peptidase domain
MPNFNVPKIGQANSKICWLACYQMMYGYDKRSTSAVWDIARRAGLSTSEGLDSKKWGKARDAMGLTSYRVGWLKEDIDNLTHVLSKSGPMWCAGDFMPDGSPHAIVISGYDGEKLRINDPYEIYKFDSYNWYTFGFWKSRVKDLPFGCQVWP